MRIQPIRELEVALTCIETFDGAPEGFKLVISDELNDAMGMNMAMITDKILGRGWMPDGFEECAGYRVYRYKESD
jgi:hypothetical protein